SAVEQAALGLGAIAARAHLERAQGVDGHARGTQVALELATQRIRHLAERRPRGMEKIHGERLEQLALAIFAHRFSSRSSSLASFHSASISSSVDSEGVLPLVASRSSM